MDTFRTRGLTHTHTLFVGSGKSLALLCGALAWLGKEAEKQKDASDMDGRMLPRIYVGSRTSVH